MKIHPNTHKGAPLQDAIDDFAEAYEAQSKSSREAWQIRLYMADKLGVKEETITEKDVHYFCLRMGVVYLARKIRGIGTSTAERLCREAQEALGAK